MSQNIVEYLYVDVARLDSYVSQISGGLVTYDKVPTYSTEIGLTGPKAGTVQARHARPLSVQEKLNILREHIKKVPDASNYFKEHDVRAYKVLLPRSVFKYPPELPEIVFWLSDYNSSSSLLYLLEGRTNSDGKPSVWSSFSALKFVAGEFGVELDVPSTDDPNDPDISPVEFFKSAGALVSEPRPITSLYRVRQEGGTGPSMFLSVTPFYPVIIGYPVYVAAFDTPS